MTDRAGRWITEQIGRYARSNEGERGRLSAGHRLLNRT